MTTEPEKVSDHYTVADLANRILAALEAAGKDREAIDRR